MPDPGPGSSGETPQHAPTDDRAEWRVDRRLTVAKIAGAAIFALAAAIGYPDPGQVIVVGLASVLLALLAVRDLIAPVRLTAGPAGLTVTTGFAGRRGIAWGDIDHIKVDARKGLMLRSQVLELDAGDHLYFFGVNELGAPCDEVAERLAAIRSRSAP
jgi:hypothetical protein